MLNILDDDAVVPDDEAPPTDDTGHYCLECGKPVVRRGTRGRWPSYCDEHSKTRSSGTKGSKGRSTAGQARKAAAVLGNLNGMICVALVAPIPGSPIYLPETASVLASKSEVFEEQAAAALENDPELTRMILRGGALSGRAALVMAYGMLAGSVAPYAIAEWKDRRANRGA